MVASNLTLPRFQAQAALVDANGNPSQAFHIWWDTFASNLEKAFNDLSDNVATIATIQADLVTQLAAIEAAQTAADSAQTTANTVNRNDSISTSWTSPGTALSASDAGTSATITVAGHTRHYSNTSTATLASNSITGLSYSTTYYVYYDDPAQAGGAVTYNAVTDPNTALPGAAAGRHYVGVVTTPASGGTATTGTGSSGGAGGSFGGGQIP